MQARVKILGLFPFLPEIPKPRFISHDADQNLGAIGSFPYVPYRIVPIVPSRLYRPYRPYHTVLSCLLSSRPYLPHPIPSHPISYHTISFVIVYYCPIVPYRLFSTIGRLLLPYHPYRLLPFPLSSCPYRLLLSLPLSSFLFLRSPSPPCLRLSLGLLSLLSLLPLFSLTRPSDSSLIGSCLSVFCMLGVESNLCHD